MSGVALDVPVASTEPRSFMRVLWAVLLGYLGASITLFALALPLYALAWLPRPFARPGPFPVDGAWSLDADLVVTVVVVLCAAMWIRRMVRDAVRGPVSFGVVALAVGLTGYAPFLALRPAALSGVIALPATTWIIRRYAIGTTLPFRRPSRRVWLVLALVCVGVFGSYRVYHPLTETGGYVSGTYLSGKRVHYREITLKNSDWADMTILRVDGGRIRTNDAFWKPPDGTLPYTLHSRREIEVDTVGKLCIPRDVIITFSVLGRTGNQRFTFGPDWDCAR
jgi:hypothetical protein